MIAEPNRYRGFLINIEMLDGQFLPAFHDPMNHKKDSWQRVLECRHPTQDRALYAIQKHLDWVIECEAKSVIYNFNQRGIKV